MTYNLILTSKQAYMVQYHIYDLCNYFVHGDHSDEKIAQMDEYDQFRIKIYRKESKYKTGYYIYKGLTEKELRFLGGEIDYHTSYGEKELWEKAMAKRISNKVKDALNISLQRDLKLKELGIC